MEQEPEASQVVEVAEPKKKRNDNGKDVKKNVTLQFLLTITREETPGSSSRASRQKEEEERN